MSNRISEVKTPPPLFDSGGTNLPAVLILRAVQMLLTLVVLKLTYSALSGADFLLFNSVLFAVAIASAVVSPSVRAIWRDDKTDVVLDAALVNAGISSAVVGILMATNRGLIQLYTLPSVVAVVFAAIVYCSGKSIERALYAGGFTNGKQGLSYLVAFAFIATELGVLVVVPNQTLTTRLFWPASVFLVATGLRSRGFVRQSRRTAGKLRNRVVTMLKEEYASRTGLLAVIYTIVFTTSGMIERVLPNLRTIDAATASVFNDYLLVLAYGVAFQSLLSIAVDWARPKMSSGGGLLTGAGGITVKAVAAMAGIATAAAFAGLPLLQRVDLAPTGISMGLWAVIIARFTLQVTVFLLQVDLILTGRIWRAIVPWLLLIAAQVTALTLASGGGDPLVLSIVTSTVICGLIVAAETGFFVKRLAA